MVWDSIPPWKPRFRYPIVSGPAEVEQPTDEASEEELSEAKEECSEYMEPMLDNIDTSPLLATASPRDGDGTVRLV